MTSTSNIMVFLAGLLVATALIATIAVLARKRIWPESPEVTAVHAMTVITALIRRSLEKNGLEPRTSGRLDGFGGMWGYNKYHILDIQIDVDPATAQVLMTWLSAFPNVTVQPQAERRASSLRFFFTTGRTNP